jgi:hypothetical protein
VPLLESAILLGVAGTAAWDAIKSLAASGGSSSPAGYPIVSTDPGIVPGAPLGVGVSRCPTNPPPPAGFTYWPARTPVSSAVSAWASATLRKYPIGTFVQDVVAGQLVAARVEYHTWLGATGQTGCFKGVSLMVPIP